MGFVNRVPELTSMERLLKDPKAKLALLYGRRRLGKTALLVHLLEHYGGLYFTIPEQTAAGILRYLNTELQAQTKRNIQYASIRDFLADLATHGKRLVVLDEVQRLFEADKAAASTLQELWDKSLSKSNLVLFLCGSVIGTLNRLRDAKSPLYGRFAWTHHLQPFTYAAVRLFPLARLSPETAPKAVNSGPGICWASAHSSTIIADHRSASRLYILNTAYDSLL